MKDIIPVICTGDQEFHIYRKNLERVLELNPQIGYFVDIPRDFCKTRCVKVCRIKAARESYGSPQSIMWGIVSLFLKFR